MKFTIVLALLLKVTTGLSQSELVQHSTYDCIYTTIFSSIGENGTNYRTYSARLFISQNSSSFFVFPSKTDQLKEQQENLNHIISYDTMLRVFKQFNKELLLFEDPFIAKQGMFFSDTLNCMKWVITNETKYIDSLLCTGAYTLFRGRKYTAWFCTSIPIANGPWKLGGLPGLIIEAYDIDYKTHFLLKSINETKDSDIYSVPSVPTHYYSYSDYLAKGKTFVKRIRDAVNSKETGECLECQTKSKVSFDFLENVFD